MPRRALIYTLALAFFLGPLNAFSQMEMPPKKPRGTASMVSNAPGPNFDLGEFVDPTLTPLQQLGKRLFMETRFSNYFARNCLGDVNRKLTAGEPTVATVQLRGGNTKKGPFAGQSMNCRSCHFVEELFGARGGGTRDYADFASRSPLPEREDGLRVTHRNSMSMVDSTVSRTGTVFLHADGEFTSTRSVVEATLTGRNLGWLPTESAKATAHVVRVIREDNGKNRLGALFGGSYNTVFRGGAEVPELFRLPEENRLDVARASDDELFRAIGNAIAAYLNSLVFFRDSNGAHNGSPYDLFLAKNGLPRAPNPGESDAQYTERLRVLVEELKQPKWVVPADGFFRFHNQFYRFGPTELEGLRIFLRSEAPATPAGKRLPSIVLFCSVSIFCFGAVATRSRGRLMQAFVAAAAFCFVAGLVSGPAVLAERGHNVGNCSSCHTAPNFTDYVFHNTGASQEEYDAAHGEGSFVRVKIPSLSEREASWDRYLPATPQHPSAMSNFRSPATPDAPGKADLGMWNVFANSDFPDPQRPMKELLCGQQTQCSSDEALRRSIARFRTPTLRDLGHSDPYLHNGSKAEIEDVVRFYIRMSLLARQGKLRNGDPKLLQIRLTETDVNPLVAFLRSLNEDYE